MVPNAIKNCPIYSYKTLNDYINERLLNWMRAYKFFSDKLFMEGGEILSDKHGLSFV